MTVSPPPRCGGCGRPVPPPLPRLERLILDELDRRGPISGRELAITLRRRKATVLGTMRQLEAGGHVYQVVGKHGLPAWATVARAEHGTGLEPADAAGAPADALRVIPQLVGAVAALAGSAGLPRRLIVGAAIGATVAVLLAHAEARQ